MSSIDDTSDSSSTSSTTSVSTDVDASDDTSSSDVGASSATATTNYSALVPIPSGINSGLTSPSVDAMMGAFGNPGTPDPKCGTSSAALQKLMRTDSVGPFRVTGFGPALDALTRVFAAVQSAEPNLYSVLGTEGMLCVRMRRTDSTKFSNHSWGTAIDIEISGVETPQGSKTLPQGLASLAPYMNAERFFWGAAYSVNPDPMHFECSTELINDWKADGTIP